MRKLISLLFLLLLYSQSGFAQNNEDLLISKNTISNNAAYYDLSDPTGVSIEVSIWGFVKYPGRYKIPYNTTFLDLMSYSGGPNVDANLENIRIYRPPADTITGKTEVTTLNYNDLMWEEKISPAKKGNPILKMDDIVMVLQDKKYNFREDIMYFLPIISTLITFATFILTLTK